MLSYHAIYALLHSKRVSIKIQKRIILTKEEVENKPYSQTNSTLYT